MKRLFLLLAVIFVAASAAHGQKKSEYHAEWDAGVDIISPLEGFLLPTIHTVHGVRFSDRVFVGGGIGVSCESSDSIFMPIYANVKCFFAIKKEKRPFLSFDIGYSAFLAGSSDYDMAGLYISPAFGLKYKRFKFQVGYMAQQIRWSITRKAEFYSAGHVRFGMMF